MVSLLILPAAGSGRRLGRSEPKALVPLLGRPLLSWTMDALASVAFARIVVVVAEDRTAQFEKLVRGRAAVVPGGPTRSSSVRRGFEALGAADDDLICIHDAARPLITAEEAQLVLARAQQTGAATAATPIVDTVKRVESERVVATIERDGLYAAGTPQAFRADLLRRAFDTGRRRRTKRGSSSSSGSPWPSYRSRAGTSRSRRPRTWSSRKRC